MSLISVKKEEISTTITLDERVESYQRNSEYDLDLPWVYKYVFHLDPSKTWDAFCNFGKRTRNKPTRASVTKSRQLWALCIYNYKYDFANSVRARLAQSVEHQTFNLRVKGSSPLSGEKFFFSLHVNTFFFSTSGKQKLPVYKSITFKKKEKLKGLNNFTTYEELPSA